MRRRRERNPTAFGELLAGVRTRNHVTQDAMAERLGVVAKRTLTRWEAGDRMPSVLQIPLIVRTVYAFDPAGAEELARVGNTTLLGCGIAPPPVALPAPPSPVVASSAPTSSASSPTSYAAPTEAAAAQSVALAVLAACDALDLPPGRVRAALAAALRVFRESGVSVKLAEEALAKERERGADVAERATSRAPTAAARVSPPPKA